MNPKYLIKIAVLACFGLWSAAYAYEPPKIGDVLHAPESSQADDDRRVVTMLITQFAYPNINYPILESTVETLKNSSDQITLKSASIQVKLRILENLI